MSKMSEYHSDLEAIKRVMEDDCGEPQTPKEIAEHKVAMAVRDCWLASAELLALRSSNPHASQFINKSEGDLWSIKLRVDALIEEIRAANGDTALPPPYTAPRFKMVSR